MSILKIVSRTALPVLASLALFAAPAQATIVFSDNFDGGASADWGNEVGSWRDTGGVYDASAPGNQPTTYSSVTSLTSLTNFRVRVDVNDVDDGGIWLRSSFNGGNRNGVLLVTGGNNGTADTLYWHTVVNGAFSPVQQVANIPGLQGSDIQLTVDVIGDVYTAFVDGNAIAATSLTTTLFASGSVGLYDFSPISGAAAPRGQTFDNFSIETLSVAEPFSAAIIAFGIAGMAVARKRRK